MEIYPSTSFRAAEPKEAVASAPTEAHQHDLVFLNGAKVRLFRAEAGTIVRAVIDDPNLGPERSYRRVYIARAFPFTRPDTYIGLRDGRDRDIGMLAALTELEPESAQIVEEELERRYFLPKIEKVDDVKEEGGGMTKWRVQTDRGERDFYVQNIRESVTDIAAHRLLMTDVDGNRYEFPDSRTLPDKILHVLQRTQ